MTASERTNEDRAEIAYRVALVYGQWSGSEGDVEASIIDLMADLLHLCDQYGLEQSYAQAMALEHFTLSVSWNDEIEPRKHNSSRKEQQ